MGTQEEEKVMSTMPMAQEDHPAHNIPDATQQYAGDVLPLRPGDMSSDMSTAARQVQNQRSIDNIAKNGPKSVDTTNLSVLRPK